jgi:hypothetical protein
MNASNPRLLNSNDTHQQLPLVQEHATDRKRQQTAALNQHNTLTHTVPQSGWLPPPVLPQHTGKLLAVSRGVRVSATWQRLLRQRLLEQRLLLLVGVQVPTACNW